MIDLIDEILATLRHNKLRTALTGFAVSWGIFLLIVLLSLSQGLINGMEGMFAKRDTESITIEGGHAQKPYEGLTEDRNITLRQRDLGMLASRNASTVAQAVPELSNDTAQISTSRDYVTGGYKGVYPSELKGDGATMVEGRFINDNDINLHRRVVVLHRDNARNLFGKEKATGKLVKIGDLSFTVAGVFTHEWNTRSYIPYTTAHDLSGKGDEIKKITVKVRDISSVEEGTEAEQSYYVTLGKEHRFDPSDKSALRVWNRVNQHLKQSTAMDALVIAVWVICLLTMLSGVVGVSNIMFVSVRERTHEIGVRRAIGARPLSILKQIMLESVAITTLFGYIGIVAGVGVAGLIDYMATKANTEYLVNPTVDLGVALEVTLVLITAGALAGLFPALKSIKIKPVEALRDE